MTLDDILETAGWASECCFSKYYNKPVVKVSNYANSTLPLSRVEYYYGLHFHCNKDRSLDVCGFSSYASQVHNFMGS